MTSKGMQESRVPHPHGIEDATRLNLLVDERGHVVHVDSTTSPFIAAPPRAFPQPIDKVLLAELVPVIQDVLADTLAREEPSRQQASFSGEDGPLTVWVAARPVGLPGYATSLMQVSIRRQVDGGEEPSRQASGLLVLGSTEEDLHRSRQYLQAFMAEHRAGFDNLKHLNEDIHRVSLDLIRAMDDLEMLNRDFHHILSGLHVAVLFIDGRLRVQRFSPLLSDLFEIEASDQGRPLAELTHHLEYDEIVEDARGVLRDHAPRTREVLADTGAWYHVLVRPGVEREGTLDEVLFAFLDISERKRTETELRNSEDRWRQLVQLHPEPILISVDGVIAFTNEAGARVFGGASVEDIIGRSVFEFIVPKLHDVFRRRMRRVNQGKSTVPYEHQLVRLDGARRDVIAASIPVVYRGRQAAQTVIRDITERKRVEQELRDERNFNEAVLDTVDAIIVVLDQAGHIVRMNRACEDFTGYTEEEVLGDNVVDRFVPPEYHAAARSYLKRVRDGARRLQVERYWLTRSGERRLVAWSTTTIADDAGNPRYIIGTGIDITERRMLEQAVLHITEEERQRFGRDLHDGLGSQLTGIAMLTRGVIQDLRAGREVQVKEVEEIGALVVQSAEKARALAQGLNPVQLEAEGLTAALRNLAEGVHKLADMSGAFECTVDRVPLDGNALSQLYWIAQEAVSNAMKHAHAAHVWIRLDEDDGSDPPHLHLSIEDDGIGFDPDRIGSPGMGLHTMQYRARLIGAHLTVDARPGAGTAVHCTVSLPVEEAGPAPA